MLHGICVVTLGKLILDVASLRLRFISPARLASATHHSLLETYLLDLKFVLFSLCPLK